MNKYTLSTLAITVLLSSFTAPIVLAEDIDINTTQTGIEQLGDEFDIDIFDDSDSNQNISEDISSGKNLKINYSVPGKVPVIAQPTSMSCWSAAATMMLSWQDKSSYTIEQVMERAGKYYLKKFNSSNPRRQGLYPKEEEKFYAALGMKKEAPQNYDAKGLLSLLKTYGPLLVVGNEGQGSSRPMIHARVITGIYGDGTPDGTVLQINDSAGGRRYQESFRSFAKKYEDVASLHNEYNLELRAQIVHF